VAAFAPQGSGKSSLSEFELIFTQLQGELQKIKDTGVELQNSMNAPGGKALIREFYIDASAFSRRICLLRLTHSLPSVHYRI
jgi:hypothetical protein